MKRISGLHVIVGGANEARTLELARLAQEEGAAVVQLREKFANNEIFIRTAEKVRKVLSDTTFIVNDRANIAAGAGSDGVHLGQSDMPLEEARALLGPEAIIGLSTSNVNEALAAESGGANYVGFGHMFLTRSKEKLLPPRTMEELRAAVGAVTIPVIAIGGITESNLQDIMMPGLGGIAVISAIGDSRDARVTIRNLVRSLEERHATYA